MFSLMALSFRASAPEQAFSSFSGNMNKDINGFRNVRGTWVAGLAAAITTVLAKEQQGKPNFDMARADAMIEFGRDQYDQQHAPRFGDTIYWYCVVSS